MSKFPKKYLTSLRGFIICYTAKGKTQDLSFSDHELFTVHGKAHVFKVGCLGG